MQGWVQINREAFERDVLRDFCLASEQLGDQFARFAASGTVSFPVLRSLVGEPWDKGLLWRLKDKSHHVLPQADDASLHGLLLDWTLGYVFHESLKLMEAAHQRQYYAPKLFSLPDRGPDRGPDDETERLINALRVIQGETRASMRRETARLAMLLRHARRLFCLYFTGRAGHRPLARFLHDNNALARHVFRDDYLRLVRAVYGDAPERMHLEAARSLLESAREEAAAGALAAALAINPDSAEARELKALHGL
ncbi:MAG: hypothetical protein LBH65_04720 [Desulfovibrio sp.]|jgi:hypothetical protein|nr:hypothetical protein [Desulfovibrio sp.]